VQTNNVTFTPLPTITHTTEVPDTGELLNLINEQRRSGNRTELTVDERLKSVAEKRLNDMIASQQYSHKNLEGKYYYDLLSGYGYTAAYSCENLDIEELAWERKWPQRMHAQRQGNKNWGSFWKVQR
jgi:uncharacterized protein YkwD